MNTNDQSTGLDSDENRNRNEEQNGKEDFSSNTPQTERDKKLIWIFFTICISLIILSSFPLYFLLESNYDMGGLSLLRFTTFILLGMGIASFSLGVLHSYARFSGTYFKGHLQLGGAIVIIGVVVALGILVTEIGTGITPFKLTILKEFSEDTTERNLTIQRILPINFNNENIAPIQYDSLSRTGVYSINTINISSCNMFKAFIRPTKSLEEISLPNTKNNAKVLFSIDRGKLAQINRPEVIIYIDKNMNVEIDSSSSDISWLDASVTEDMKMGYESIFYSTAYASQDGQKKGWFQEEEEGWIVPNLETLKNHFLLIKDEFYAFSMKIDTKYTAKTNRINYVIFIDNTPVYIDGQGESFIYTDFEKYPVVSFGITKSIFDSLESEKIKISVRMRLYHNEHLLDERSIVRDFDPKNLADKLEFEQKGFKCTWSDTYYHVK